MKRVTVGLPRHALPTPPSKGSQEGRTTSQADQPAPEGTAHFSPSHPYSGSCICTWPTRWHWQKDFASSSYLSLCLPLTPGSPLAADRYREGLPPTETSHHLPTPQFPSSPAIKLPNQLDTADFIRQLGDGQRQYNWRQIIFSNKSLRFSTLQLSLLPRIFHISWKM